MYIKYNYLSIIIISMLIITALSNYAFAKQKQKCFTCVCKDTSNKTKLTEPKCNFESILTNKTINDLPNDLVKQCTQDCQHSNLAYTNHLSWSE